MSRPKKYANGIVEEEKTKVQKVDNEIEVKKAKIASLISEINVAHKRDIAVFSFMRKAEMLRLIFDYDKLNDYGKVIIENTEVELGGSYTWWSDFKKMDNNSEQPLERKVITEKWVEHCREISFGRSYHVEAFYFILSALLVVTVDENDKEKNLSMVCDFARMLRITDDEVKDMIELIKVIYGQDDWNILKEKGFSTPSQEDKEFLLKKQEQFKNDIKSERTLKMFRSLISSYVRIDINDEIFFR